MYGPAEPRSYPVVTGLTTVQSRAAAQRRPCPWRSSAPVPQNQNADRRGCPPHRVGRVAAGRVFAVTFTNKAADRNEQPDPDSTADRRHPGSGFSTVLPRASSGSNPRSPGRGPASTLSMQMTGAGSSGGTLKALNLASGDGGTA